MEIEREGTRKGPVLPTTSLTASTNRAAALEPPPHAPCDEGRGDAERTPYELPRQWEAAEGDHLIVNLALPSDVVSLALLDIPGRWGRLTGVRMDTLAQVGTTGLQDGQTSHAAVANMAKTYG